MNKIIIPQSEYHRGQVQEINKTEHNFKFLLKAYIQSYSVLAAAALGFFALMGLCERRMAEARRRVALHRSVRQWLALSNRFTLWSDRLAPTLNGRRTRFFAGLFVALAFLYTTVKPFLLGFSTTPTAFLWMRPLYLNALRLVTLFGSLLKGFLMLRFFTRKALLFLIIIQLRWADIFVSFHGKFAKQRAHDVSVDKKKKHR